MKNNYLSRRNFLKTSVITTGLAAFSPIAQAGNSTAPESGNDKLPREVWIASISQSGLRAQTSQLMIEKIAGIVNNVIAYHPDIICLPETFPFTNIDNHHNLADMLEISKTVIQQFAAIAKKNSCYLICPVYTSKEGKVYNTAVVFNRDGSLLGEYRKIHLTKGEIAYGLTPGPLDPPVFQTDFGKIGIQICWDIEWDDSWTKLRNKGAEIVFWPSAFAAGKMINTKAWQHKYVVVSSTGSDTTKICDIDGEVIAQTGIWERNSFCAAVNLEKAFLHTYPYREHFQEIRNKYGRKVRITTFDEEEWSIIESLSPEVYVADILKEYSIATYEQTIHDDEMAQIKARKD